eukprot:GHVS01072408.1.p1 GENE.GHVS01072408.1~~GHVS01072408.1.p1  ORF type:complete len:320 (-),score=43.40 GHVS01072408.1:90-1049(-)
MPCRRGDLRYSAAISFLMSNVTLGSFHSLARTSSCSIRPLSFLFFTHFSSRYLFNGDIGVYANGGRLARRLSSSSCYDVVGEYAQAGNAVYLTRKDKERRSFWHDVALLHTKQPKVYNMVVEIPRYTTAKMEIYTNTENTPIKQDIKNNCLRFYHGPLYWNYGAFPQTWENPEERMAGIGGGDNDPLDVVEVTGSGGEAVTRSVGDVVQIKVLGGLCLIDGGEVDWKILAVDMADPHIGQLSEVEDIDRIYPGTTSGVREWFRWYKTPDGKPPNRFALDGRVISRVEAEQVIDSAHRSYHELLQAGQTGTTLWLPPKHR